MSRFFPIALSVLLVISSSACGLRKPLMLPPGPAPEPLLGNAPAIKNKASHTEASHTVSTQPSDLSTDQKATPQ